MSTLQERIKRLKEKIASYRNLREDLGEEADRSIAALEKELAALIETDGGAAVLGDVDTRGGDFTGRDKITTNIYQGAYHGLAPRGEKEALQIYLGTIIDRCGLLPLQGFSDQTSDATTGRPRLSLPGVYIHLNTQTSVDPEDLESALKRAAPISLDDLKPDREDRISGHELAARTPLTALQGAILARKLVLLGDPGSGKTTFANYLAHCLAAHNWDDLPGWPKKERTVLPVLVTLRDFAYWLAGCEEKDRKGAHCLWAYILYDLKTRNLEFAGPLLEQALEDGRVLLLLDGLDEVPPTKEARGAVLRAVQDLAGRYKGSRYLVTCRVLSYQEKKWRLTDGDFIPLTLAPFTDEQIDTFIHAWHTEIAVKWNKPRQALEKLEAKLKGEVSRRGDLRRLAANPLLLTVMALVHTSDGELPEARALLYGRAVEILLWRWEQEKGKEQGAESLILSQLRAVGRTRGDLLVALAKLAFEAHHQVQADDDAEAVTGISEKDLLDELRRLHPDGSRDWAASVVETMKLRSGLLLERTGGVFTFPHRTFQEYLAGMHLARQPNFTTEALACFEQGDFWRIVVLLAVGYLVHDNKDYDKPRLLIEELCPPDESDDPAAWKRAWLAGEALLELGVNRAADTEHGQRLLERLRGRLAALVEGGKLTPRERLVAGDALGSLGDPRFDEARFSLPVLLRGQPEPLLGFVRVPAGKFIMGSDEKDDQAYSAERPQHTLDLPEFYIARYPVTNAQYHIFMEAGGYGERRYWTAEGWAWRNGAAADLSPIEDEDEDFKKRYEQWLAARPAGQRDQPFWGNHPQWGAVTRPVVGISWYEAMAYCAWLGEKLVGLGEQRLRKAGRMPALEKGFWRGLVDGSLRVSLPSEAQWEKASRGEKGRRFPWGNEWREEHANIEESGLKETSPVGLFPQGATPYGLLDASGNVWEWTHSRWGRKSISNPDYGYPYNPGDGREDEGGPDLRILRCGSWFDPHGLARCAFRLWDLPDSSTATSGFVFLSRLAILVMILVSDSWFLIAESCILDPEPWPNNTTICTRPSRPTKTSCWPVARRGAASAASRRWQPSITTRMTTCSACRPSCRP